MTRPPRRNGRAPTPGEKGHNSEGADVAAEILKLAKKQLALDKKREAFNTSAREDHQKITAQLKELGVSRRGFGLAYALFSATANADSPEDERKAKDKNIVYLNEFHTVYKALNEGEQLSWLDVAKQADKATTRLHEDAESAESEEREL